VLSKTIRGRFGRSGLEVVEIAISLLIIGETASHMVEDFDGERLSVFVGQIMLDPASVEAGFVHADQADGREVVLEGAKIVLGVRIESAIEQGGDGLAFDLSERAAISIR
jgi:hypothetical protein